MPRIAVISTGRQDWGIMRELCRILHDADDFELVLMLGGMHLSKQFGCTRDLVMADGFTAAEEIDWIDDDKPLDPERQAGDSVWMTAEALGRQNVDSAVVLGDRFETLSVALAATIMQVPLIHLHGGEETEGAIDNAFRHAITKLSHLHFTSHENHTKRVIAMGEDPAVVHTVGAPGLDNLHRSDLPERRELEEFLGLQLDAPVVMVTLHPITLGGDPAFEAQAVSDAMDRVDARYVITLPNTDPGNETVREILKEAGSKAGRMTVDALGERRYWGMLRLVDALLGNSSSAIIEAPAVGLPAVNVGNRQKGRQRGENIVDAEPTADAVTEALEQVLSADFQAHAKAAPSPFGDGMASRKIMDILRAWEPSQPPTKRAIPV